MECSLLCMMLVVLGGSCGPGSPAIDPPLPDAESMRRSLLSADRGFNRATQERGADGWVSSFDEEGAMIQAGRGEIRGLGAIREAMTGVFSSPGVSLTWDPVRAHASNDGSLGFTVGRYESTSRGADGEPAVGHGLYVSVWRKQLDGSWKVIMDLGNPVASASVPLSAQSVDVRGAWNAETYIMKAGAEHRVEGRIFFTESDWQVVFFVVDEEGDIKRGSAEGGTYTLAGDALTFWHLHNFSTGEAMEGLEEAPLRMVYRDLENAPEEPANAYVDGDRLTLAFPSGNKLIFTRSSR